MISWFYTVFFFVVLFAWPLAFSEKVAQPDLVIAVILNTATAMCVIYQCSSKELNFIRGVHIIAASSMSGCVNITILYLPLLLTIVYLIAVYYSVVSLFLGREHAQGRWLTLVEGFHNRRLNAPLNPMTYLAPPDPATFKIDPDDPQSLLESASLWEMEGEWEKAIDLFQQAAEKLRGQQDGVYAENCILRVREKIARAEGGGPT